ncbi:hypothetical protein POM88_011864 [Heracleum sosnowskyi]|uniref:Uncharacterized protein n=1 Tax=Heracleum sosnowskyi TaxID=360622 RepID=A0AAD8N2U6_9APIA|nr:hypothetical protein POM88_011864 [Heracleum sosnowskyi]
MWPYLDKAICKTAKNIAKPIIAEQIPKYKIESVEFEALTLGSLPPTFHGNPNVTVVVNAYGLKATVQVVDLQVFASPRITLKPLVPSIPCFANIFVSLMEKVDWLNKFHEHMWPYLDKAICKTAKNIAKPIIAEQIPKYKIESVEFEALTLGSLPPTFHGNPNVTVVVNAYGLKATVQVVDLQVFASPRITLKPLVPSIPCFANIFVSLMEKSHVDFGLKLLGADLMSIPGAYRFVQIDGGSDIENLGLQNIQARIRMVLAFMLASLMPWVHSKTGFQLVLSTSNVDEGLRGHLTKVYEGSPADKVGLHSGETVTALMRS